MNINKVCIIGRGAVGTLFGSLIRKKLENDKFFFIVGEDRVHKYQENPFYCNGEQCDFNYLTPSNPTKVDLLIISTKYPVLIESLKIVKPFIKEDTIILCLLNGISSEGIVEETLQKGIVIHSIAQLMDAVKNENGVNYTKAGEIVIGTNDIKKQEALKVVSEFLKEVNIAHHVASDIIHEQWSKLMLNCGINQICAVYDVTYEGCQKDGELRELFKNVMKEVATIASYEGVNIEKDEITSWIKAVDILSKDSMPSMRQDVLANRYTEVDLFSKTIMELAKKHGIDAPLNEMLYYKIKDIERNY